MPFEPGESGNPFGRPKGARNKATLARAALLGTTGDAVERKLADLLKRGHAFALGAFDPAGLARFRRQARRNGARQSDAGEAAALILEALACGELSAAGATAMLLGRGRRLQTVAENNGIDPRRDRDRLNRAEPLGSAR